MTSTWTGPERREEGRLYGRTATDLTGALEDPGPTVRYRPVLTGRQRRASAAMGWVHIALAAAMALYVAMPGHLPALGRGAAVDALTVVGVVVIVLLQLVAGVRTWAVTYHASRAEDPVPVRHRPGLRVAVLTTIVPGKEPVEMVMTTLRAMRRIRHDGPLDVWLLDEGDDPELAMRCAELGVHHFSRRGVEAWNTASGPFRARTKHGNHNAWRADHEADYDVVAQMDPDHVPFPNFLERTLGYFEDPDTAFVVAPQVYGNLTESFVARGAAQLAYLFHGIIQRGGNGHAAPLLIGTNHLYRPSAFGQIGGYQDSIIEDHLTSMVLYTEVNPATGRPWKGVYTPDVIAVGEGPATYGDFFSQQKRWAYGIWQIARRHSPHVLRAMQSPSQRASFLALQLHYPTLALTWVGGVVLSALYLMGGVTVTTLPVSLWAGLFAANFGVGWAFNQYLRRFNLVAHERRGLGLAGIVLDLVTAPVYVAAAAAQLSGRPLAYVVTPKGTASTADSLRTFRPHLIWAAVALGSIATGLALGHRYPSLHVWAAITAVISLAPIAHVVASRVTVRMAGRVRGARPISSVVAHRRVGEALVAAGVLTDAQLRALLDEQATSDAPWLRLGDLVVANGMATPDEVAAALDATIGAVPRHPVDRHRDDDLVGPVAIG
jgi:hypothetical protein